MKLLVPNKTIENSSIWELNVNIKKLSVVICLKLEHDF